MKRNYYEILEIDKKASPEVIKKAYNTLVKKYHPDLQPEDIKHTYEEKIKLINEAYEVLSNEEKRKQYDIELSNAELENDKLTDELLNENDYLKQELNRIKNDTPHNTPKTNSSNSFNNINFDYQNQIQYEYELQQARKKAYYDAYIQDLKNRGYKIKYKKTIKDHFKNFITLLITIVILFLLLQIPFIKSFFINLYEENNIIKTIVNIILNLFK